MACCVIRFRHRKDGRAAYEPENKKLEWWLTGVTTVGVAAMLAPGPVRLGEVRQRAGGRRGLRGRGPAVALALSLSRARTASWAPCDARYVSDENPFGMNPDDPDGQDDVLVASPELHLPLGKPVKLLLRSMDVLHNFAVAAVPRQDGPGAGHGHLHLVHAHPHGNVRPPLRGTVRRRRTSPCAARSWWTEPAVPGLAGRPSDLRADARRGRRAMPRPARPLYAACAACHGAQGEGNRALNAPKLTGQGDWYLQRQLKYFKQGARGTHEQGRVRQDDGADGGDAGRRRRHRQCQRPTSATLPDTPAAGHGQRQCERRPTGFTSTCGACHGADGRGVAGDERAPAARA